MSKIKVGTDVNELISNTRDYISDALTTLESAADKIAYLGFNYTDIAVEDMASKINTLLIELRASKRKSARLVNMVEE